MYAQNSIGQGAACYNEGGQAPGIQSERKTCLDAINRELDQALKTLSLVSERQKRLIGRIFGAVPECEKNSPRPQQAGSIGAIADKLQDINTISGDLMAQLSRLDELA